MATALYARVSKDYQRKKLPDGKFVHEHFAIANGGFLPSAYDDEYVKKVRYVDVANMVLKYLGPRGYYLAHDTKSAELLIVVKWGTTTPRMGQIKGNLVEQLGVANRNFQAANSVGAAALLKRGGDGAPSAEAAQAAEAKEEFLQALFMEQAAEAAQRMDDTANARLLGYMDEINSRDNPSQWAGAGTAFHDLWEEIEEPRYFVVLEAYDFHEMQERHTAKVLWTLRVSVQAQHNRFDQCLATMIARASEYAGKSSRYLIHEDRAGVVTIGELKALGVATAPEPAKK